MADVPIDQKQLASAQQQAITGGRIFLRSSSQLDPGLVKYQLNNDPELQKIALKLRGYRYNPDTKDLIQDEKFRLMNEYGIEVMVDIILAGVASKGVLLSNLNTNETYVSARIVMVECASLLAQYNKEFGVKDMATQTAIMAMFKPYILSMFKRPFEQGERRFIKEIGEEKRVITEGPERGRGLFGR